MNNTSTYSRFSTDSIRLMAESASVPDQLSIEVANALSEDVTFRISQIIVKAKGFMRHSNRNKLTCSDINRALRWSNCQPVYGHEPNPNERLRYSYCAEAQVFRYEENTVDLDERYKNQPKTEILIKDEMKKEASPKLSIELAR